MKQQRCSSCYLGGLVLVAALVGRASCQRNSVGANTRRFLQDVPTVGLGFGSSSTTSISASPSGSASEIEEVLIAALETDYQVTGEKNEHTYDDS